MAATGASDSHEDAKDKKEEHHLKLNNHRFYEAEFPKQGELVMVQVADHSPMGTYATLLEYNGARGFYDVTEDTRARTRPIKKKKRGVGRQGVCLVLKVDPRGYIDLSKNKVNYTDAVDKEQDFVKAKAIHSIMRHVARHNNLELHDLCAKVSWPLFDKYGGAGGAYKALRDHLDGDNDVLGELSFGSGESNKTDLSNIAAKLKREIVQCLQHRRQQEMTEIFRKIEVMCPIGSGIEAVKSALRRGLALSCKDCTLEIKLVAHPVFLVTARCLNKEDGSRILGLALDAIRTEIESRRGFFCDRSGEDKDDTGYVVGRHDVSADGEASRTIAGGVVSVGNASSPADAQ